MPSKYKQIDLTAITPISFHDRHSKVSVDEFADPDSVTEPGASLNAFPPILKGTELKALVAAMHSARDRGRPIIWMVGAHVIKCGLSLYLNRLMREGYITTIATPGSATVHDLELAFFGKTSEDVADELPKGRFGMSQETARLFAQSCDTAARDDLGLGEGVGRFILEESAPHRHYSVFASAYEHSVPATVHVALGTDITHQHPEFPAAAVGELSMRDFRIFAASVADAFDGGVVIVFGSAVILPEVFLKTVSIGYNLGHKPVNVTAASFDMLPQYRVRENVLARPFQAAGSSYAFTGHHEIMLPLLYELLVRP